MRKNVLLISLFTFIAVSAVFAGEMVHKQERIDIKDADKVDFNCDLGAGEFKIIPGDIEEAAIIDIDYDSRRIKYYVDSENRGNTCNINLESERRRKSSMNTEDNKWNIQLSKKYPMTINMDIGACDADFDLGGIPIEEFSLDIGAASGTIDFSEPNPNRLREMEIDAGASSLEMTSIGNANFERFTFSGGAGSFDLDFRGKYKGTSKIVIEIGLGSGDITLPEGIPVRVETEDSNWLSSVDIHNRDLDEVDDDVLESPDFEDADTKIIIELTVGLGSLDVRWR